MEEKPDGDGRGWK